MHTDFRSVGFHARLWHRRDTAMNGREDVGPGDGRSEPAEQDFNSTSSSRRSSHASLLFLCLKSQTLLLAFIFQYFHIFMYFFYLFFFHLEINDTRQRVEGATSYTPYDATLHYYAPHAFFFFFSFAIFLFFAVIEYTMAGGKVRGI